MAFIKKITNKEEYDNFINDNEKVCIKFSAEWCAPCRLLSETISKLDSDKVNGFVFSEIDVDEQFADDITMNFGIRNIPVTVFIVNGEVKEKQIGYLTSDKIYQILNNL